VESYAAITISSPLSIRLALKFSIFLIFVLAFVRLTGFFYGSAGIPLVSFLAGLPEVDAITISLATSAEKDLPLVYAAIGILLAGIANTIFKWILTFCLGNKEFFIASGKVFIPLIAISLIFLFIFSKISL
jgi:uncharacterized membrane protein (DUF4010 family)